MFFPVTGLSSSSFSAIEPQTETEMIPVAGWAELPPELLDKIFKNIPRYRDQGIGSGFNIIDSVRVGIKEQ